MEIGHNILKKNSILKITNPDNMKSIELKITKNNAIEIQPSQIAWHTSHSRCGGVSFFLAYSPSEGLAFLFDGGLAAQIQGARFDDLRPAALFSGDLDSCASNLRPAACALWSL